LSIEVKNIVKTFANDSVALDNVSFTVGEGKLIGFLGPSGSGKTTLLRIIAGLERQSSGQVFISGRPVDDIPPQKRGVGVVFQNYALFKHMTVADNIAFGLKVQKRNAKEIHDRVAQLLDLTHLSAFASRYPRQLSGGEAQRVALARALAPEPTVLLLDEPFAAIDTKVRRELREWVRQIHDKIGVTSIFVTHDQEEALEIADRVLVINQGKVEQFGTPEEIYNAPTSLFVADFVGEANHFRGTSQAGKLTIGPLSLGVADVSDGEELDVVVRPADIKMREITSQSDIVGEIVRLSYRGNSYLVEVKLENGMRVYTYAPKESRPLYTGQQTALDIMDYKLFQGEVPV